MKRSTFLLLGAWRLLVLAASIPAATAELDGPMSLLASVIQSQKETAQTLRFTVKSEAVEDAETVAKLQALYLGLTKAFIDSNILPVSAWGTGHIANWNQGSEKTRRKGAGSVGRYVLEHVLQKLNGSSHIKPGSACLEWGLAYSRLLPQCSEPWSIEYDANGGYIDNDKKLIYGDLNSMTHSANWRQFDLILCTQVFEHIHYPAPASRNLFALTKPGGHALVTVPFLQRYHKVPHDLFRYTVDGVETVFRTAGFEVIDGWVWGDLFTTVSTMFGYGTAGLLQEEAEGTIQSIYDWRRQNPGSHRAYEGAATDFYFGVGLLLKRPLVS